MTEAKQPTAGQEATDADDSASLGLLPDGLIDDTPLESYDEESFLKSLAEDDDRPRFSALSESDDEAAGLVIAGDDADAPAEEELAEPAPVAEVIEAAVVAESAEELMPEPASVAEAIEAAVVAEPAEELIPEPASVAEAVEAAVIAEPAEELMPEPASVAEAVESPMATESSAEEAQPAAIEMTEVNAAEEIAIDSLIEEPMPELIDSVESEQSGFDLGLDELDLAAIEQVSDDGALTSLGVDDLGAAADLGAVGVGAVKSFDLDLGEKKAARAVPEAPPRPKFMFDVSFDLPEPRHFEKAPEPTPEPEPEPEIPPPPTFSEEELAAARQAGFADGQTAGYQEAMQSLESRMSQGIDAVGMFLPTLLSDRDKLAEHLSAEAARLAHALVRRALPEFNRRYGTAEIEAVVRQSMQTAADQSRIIVRVAPEVAEKITGPIESVVSNSGFAGRVSVITDPALGPADVRLDWGDGGVERLAEAVWADLTAIVARMVDGLEADTRLGSAA